MGKGGEEDDDYRACIPCTRSCHRAHGQGRASIMPRFHKTVSHYAMHTNKKNCWMQIPLGFIREHIGKDVRKQFILEGVTGFEWIANFKVMGFYAGWKAFAADYDLQKGDQLVFGLIGTDRFIVNVFDKFGTEKLSRARVESLKDRDVKRKASGDEKSQLQGLKKRKVGSTPANRVPGDELDVEESDSPDNQEMSNGLVQDLNVEGTEQLGEDGPDDSVSPTNLSAQTDTRQQPSAGGRFPVENNTSPQIGPCSVNRTSYFPSNRPEIALMENQLSADIEECPQAATSSTTSEPSSDSDVSTQVLLAKAILAKAKQKKLRKRKRNSKSAVEKLTEAIFKRERVCRSEEFSGSEREDSAGPEYPNTNRTRNGSITQVGVLASEILAEKSLDKEDEAPSGPEIGTHGDQSTMPSFTPVRIEPSDQIGGDNSIESLMHRNDMQKTNDGGALHINGVNPGIGSEREDAQISNGASDQIGEGGDRMENRAMDQEKNVDSQTNLKVSPENQDDFNKKKLQHRSVVDDNNEPNTAVQGTVVKEEPDFMNEEQNPPSMNPQCTKCYRCGLPAIENRGRTSLVGLETVVKSEDGEDIAMESCPESLNARTPSSNVRNPSRRCKQTECQEQNALDAATDFSSKLKNSYTIVVMRPSMLERNCCFLSVSCAEMFPTVSTSFILVDSEGYMRKAQWSPGRRYMKGSGWKDFVQAHGLEVNDVCVMEVIDKSVENCKVKVHIFHTQKMRKEQEVPAATPDGRIRSELGLPPPKNHTNTTMNHDDKEDGVRVEQEHRRLLEGTVKEVLKGKTPGSSNKGKSAELQEVTASMIGQGEPSKITTPWLQKAHQNAKKRKRARNYNYPPTVAQFLASASLVKGKVATQGKNGASNQMERMKKSSGEGQELPRTSKEDDSKSRKLHKVLRLIDRRKGLNGVVFLVELEGAVTQTSRKGIVKQDETGYWWVPYDHFTPDFVSCRVD